MQTLSEKLKQENRITRYCLIGSGIVCGLETFINKNYFICVNAGTGLTSDGTFVEVPENKYFQFYRPYDSTTEYSMLEYQLWELIEAKDCQDGDRSLKPQNSRQRRTPFMTDKVTLLYLEKNTAQNLQIQSHLENTNDNSESICDELFPTFTLKYLLIRKSDLLQFLKLKKVARRLMWQRLEDDEDFIYSSEYFEEEPNNEDLNKAANPALRLEEIALLRFGFAKGNPFVCPPVGEDICPFPKVATLDDIYDGNESDGENDDTSGYVQIIDEAIEDLQKEIKKLRLFKPILGNQQGWKLRETLDILHDKWEGYKTLNKGSETNLHRKYYVQYFYDWVRDLVNAYHELRWELINLMAECCPETDEFPCHLLLGMPIKGNVINSPQPLRQTFQQPPIYNGNAHRVQKVKLYFWRLQLMIRSFYLPDYLPEGRFKGCHKGLDDSRIDLDFNLIKITPSKFYNTPLSAQSIPYYYPVYDHPLSLHRFWNYDRMRTSETDHILSYHANDAEDTYSILPQIVHPLHYNLDDNDFFRIEGHIGLNLCSPNEYIFEEKTICLPSVYNQLKFQIEKYNLDFKLLVIDLNGNAITENKTASTIEQCPDESGEVTEETYNHWSTTLNLLGMEHLAGVKRGGTFILVCENGKIVADFALPYPLENGFNCEDKTDVEDKDTPTGNPPPPVDGSNVTDNVVDTSTIILDKIGRATFEEKDLFVGNISRLGVAREKKLNEIGIFTFKQIAKLKDSDLEILDKLAGTKISKSARDNNWITEAKRLSGET